jgi:GPN-loop GTPase
MLRSAVLLINAKSLTTLPTAYFNCILHFSDDFLSILYKTKLPFILVFNKTDVQTHDFALEWMQDFEAFQIALASHSQTRDDEGEPTYMNSLMNSMSLVLDEFYKHLKASRRYFLVFSAPSEFYRLWEFLV